MPTEECGWEIFDSLPAEIKEFIRENGLYIDQYDARDMLRQCDGNTELAMEGLKRKCQRKKISEICENYGEDHPEAQ
jgi:hypothetical protein